MNLDIAKEHLDSLKNYRTPRAFSTVAVLDYLITEIERLRDELRIAIGDLTRSERYRQACDDGTEDRSQDNA